MSIYVKDLFQLDTFKNFKIVAGERGLHRKIVAAQVLDFEFVDGLQQQRKIMFDKDSFVISSLLFAKDNKQILMKAIKTLVDLNISAFAYKNVIYKKLPQEILDYANSRNLPILEFQDEDAYFEDIIFVIMNQVKQDSRIELIEEQIKKLLKQGLPKEQIEVMVDAMNPNLQNKIQAFYIEIGDERKIIKLLMSFTPSEKLKRKSIISKYGKDLLIILSTDKENSNLQYKFEDALFYLGIKKEDLKIGRSSIHIGKSNVKMAIEEAVQARIVGQIESKKEITYEEIGAYQMLLPEIKSEHLQKYMLNYLQPLLNSAGDSDLIKTAVQFVIDGGDLNQASEHLFCHKNTVRYRVNKIHELIDINSNEMEFFEHLATAIRIYLINELVH
nr:PucR family transcriptional regulator [uncultured Aminipila sp.]